MGSPLIALTAIAGLQGFGLTHTFEFKDAEFYLDGKPFQLISGEMHPARVPEQYWQHRIQMIKAMGCNTVAAYLFWNYHESAPGIFDFETGNHNLKRFLQVAQQEGMWVLLRPGPYVCAEWDFGGLPAYLLSIPDLKVRCLDPRYMAAAERYMAALAQQVAPFQVTRGGPILMFQVENEYGSYGNDREYMKRLAAVWREHDIDVPFFTGDGPTPYMLEAGSLPGAASGLDSGSSDADFALAKQMNPGVPVFSSETYPGWLTHWGEAWASRSTDDLVPEVRYLLEGHKSFNLYVAHGGTNFGFWAGANSGGKGYEPDITSYDYDAPINEQGRPTPKYMALRQLIGDHISGTLPEIPKAIPAIDVPPVSMSAYASIWDNLGEPQAMIQPKPFEAMDLFQGAAVYSTRLIGHKSGKLTVTDVHDFATVFVDGKFVGTLNRRDGVNTIDLPRSDAKDPRLEILVEAMGRINYGQHMIDRKGITDRVTLNGMTLMDWNVYQLPLSDSWVQAVKPGQRFDRPGTLFRGSFDLDSLGDTFLDLSGYSKGLVWVNGHNLGRYWNIGPQQRLYCPAPWLRTKGNEVIVLDFVGRNAATIQGFQTLHEAP